MSNRLDLELVHRKLAPSRAKAQELIRDRAVLVNGLPVTKSSAPIAESDQIEILKNEVLKYVSRGGLKLEAALIEFQIQVNDKLCLDVGQSTGGFSDCLLKHGARYVFGVDVGHGQLHESLKALPNLECVENTNIKDLQQNELKFQKFDLITADVSFVSIRQILPHLKKFLKPEAGILSLVKPQFELGSSALNKRGLVKDPELYVGLKQEIIEFCQGEGFGVQGYSKSAILGGDGNEEFFIFLRL